MIDQVDSIHQFYIFCLYYIIHTPDNTITNYLSVQYMGKSCTFWTFIGVQFNVEYLDLFWYLVYRVKFGVGYTYNRKCNQLHMYLGQLVSFENRTSMEAKQRPTNAWRKYWSLKYIFKSNLPVDLECRVFDICVLPGLTYGSQILAYNTSDGYFELIEAWSGVCAK